MIVQFFLSQMTIENLVISARSACTLFYGARAGNVRCFYETIEATVTLRHLSNCIIFTVSEQQPHRNGNLGIIVGVPLTYGRSFVN